MATRPDASGESATTAETHQALFQMITGFRISQMIFVATRLGLADLLETGPQSADALAQATGAHPRSLYRLLRTLASVGIFAEDDQGRFGLTPLAEPLRTEAPGSLRSVALHFGSPYVWRSWGDLLHSVTTGETASSHVLGKSLWEYRAQHPEAQASFEGYMRFVTAPQAAAIAATYDFPAEGVVVDVAGGSGALITAILQTHLELRGILCDEPHVIVAAQRALEAAGLADRCDVCSCDFFTSVPEGGNIYILKSIIHDWDDDRAIAILRTCRRAVPADGRLLLAEHTVPPGNAPSVAKMTDLQMLVGTGGRERAAEEYRALLAAAGFKLERVISVGGDFGIVEAKPR